MNFHFAGSIDGSGLRSRLETVHLSVTYQSAVVHTENSSPTRLTSFTTRSSIKLATINEFDLMPQTFQQRWIFYNVFVKLWKFRSMFPSLFLQLTLSQRQPWTTAWQFGCTLWSLVSLVPEYGIIMSMFDKLFLNLHPSISSHEMEWSADSAFRRQGINRSSWLAKHPIRVSFDTTNILGNCPMITGFRPLKSTVCWTRINRAFIQGRHLDSRFVLWKRKKCSVSSSGHRK